VIAVENEVVGGVVGVGGDPRKLENMRKFLSSYAPRSAAKRFNQVLSF